MRHPLDEGGLQQLFRDATVRGEYYDELVAEDGFLQNQGFTEFDSTHNDRIMPMDDDVDADSNTDADLEFKNPGFNKRDNNYTNNKLSSNLSNTGTTVRKLNS